jgi:hypothetical protein
MHEFPVLSVKHFGFGRLCILPLVLAIFVVPLLDVGLLHKKGRAIVVDATGLVIIKYYDPVLKTKRLIFAADRMISSYPAMFRPLLESWRNSDNPRSSAEVDHLKLYNKHRLLGREPADLKVTLLNTIPDVGNN